MTTGTAAEVSPSRGPATLSLAGRLAFLAKDAAFYGGASAVSKLFFLVTLPILTRAFSEVDYGVVDLLTFTVLFVGTLAILGQDSAVARLFYDDEDAGRRKEVISESLALQLAMSLIVMATLWPLAHIFPLPASLEASRGTLAALVLLHVPFFVLVNFSQNLLKWTFSRRAFAWMSIGMTAVNAGLLAAAVLVAGVGVAGVLAVSLVVRLAFGLLGLFLCRGWLKWPRGFRHVPALTRFALPFGIIGVISTFVPVLERSVVGTLVGPSSLGIYAAGAAIGMIIMLPIQAFQTAWGPFSLALHKEADAAKSYDQALKAFAFIACGGVLVLTIAAPTLLRWIAGPDFVRGSVVVFPVAMALAIQGISWITEVGISISKRTHYQLHGYAAYLVVAAVTAFLLAPALGILGVGLALVAAHLSKALVLSVLAQRAHPLDWSYGRVALLVLATAAAGTGASLAAPSLGLLAATAAALAASALFAGAAWAVLFSRSERARLANLAQSFAARGGRRP